MAHSNDERKPWDKRPGETYAAHRAFKIYLNLGLTRSQTQAAHDAGLKRNQIVRWHKLHEWRPRAEAWDAHIGAIEQAKREQVAAEVAERWARRKLEAAEANWARSQELALWADTARRQMPLFEQEIHEVDAETGKPLSITIKPGKWTMATVIQAYQAAAALQTAAIMEGISGVLDDDGFDPANASPDELRAYLSKRGVKALPAPGA